MRPLAILRSLWVPCTFAIVCLALGLFERHQRETYGHLDPVGPPRSQPALRTQPLENLGQVLVELHPEQESSNLVLATALAAGGEYEPARALLEKALLRDRRDPTLLLIYARVLIAQGEAPQQVKAALDELRRFFPNEWEVARPDLEAAIRDRQRTQRRRSPTPSGPSGK